MSSQLDPINKSTSMWVTLIKNAQFLWGLALTAAAFVGAAIWGTYVQPNVDSYITNKITGSLVEITDSLRTTAEAVERLTANVEVVARGLDVVGRNVASLDDKVDDLIGFPAIVEYDRHWVSACTNDWCLAGMRIRRTVAGAECGSPTSEWFVRNHFGDEWATEIKDAPGGRLTADNYRIVTFQFQIPAGVQAGTGEFFIRLTYPDCPFAGGENVIEESPLFPFEIPERREG